ncbi:MAG: DUF7931 domain-containing protein [Caulobacteraceae bacterium]
MADYRAQVSELLSGARSGRALNGTIDHASVVVEQAFAVARSHVRILTHSLDGQCYSRIAVRKAALDFLQRDGTSLEILVEDSSAASQASTHRFLRDVLEAAPDKVSLKLVPADLVVRYRYNFLVVDDTGYRFESDRDQPIAVVAGGQEFASTTTNLTAIFTSLAAASAPIALPIAA